MGIYGLASIFILEHDAAGLWNPFSADEQASIKLFASWLESRLTPLALDAAGSGNDDEQERAAAQVKLVC